MDFFISNAYAQAAPVRRSARLVFSAPIVRSASEPEPACESGHGLAPRPGASGEPVLITHPEMPVLDQIAQYLLSHLLR